MTAAALGAPIATTRLVMRDGSTAGVRLTTPEDLPAMRRFFDELSPNSRRLRFLAPARASDDLLRRLCDNSRPADAATLIVCRRIDGEPRIVGVGSYFATGERTAEVAFAVDDDFHGKGIATALLERLVMLGTQRDFDLFSATVLPENSEMLDVFRDSGFGVHSATDRAPVEVRISLTQTSASAAAADERDRRATIASLKAMVQPSSVAVIGVSRDESNLGRRIFHALITSGYKGKVYPVNPSAVEIDGHRCYASARNLPAGVELAVIAVPRDAVLSAVDDCATAGVRGVVVISAGFAEADTRGRELQTELVERVRSYGMRMVGPNCMGVINADPAVRLNASFAESLPPSGRIALASQSGGLGLAVLNLAASRQIGVSTFFSLGNKGDVSGNDILQYAESDPATSVVLLYLESFGNPRRFGQLARRVSRTKPIVVVKSGRTPAGHRAAASHTAGLAASELTVEGLFLQSGVIRADSIAEMFDVAVCLDAQPLPRGRRVAIVTNAGGPGILAADACTAAGLEVPAEIGGAPNPVDLIASAGADAYRDRIAALLASADIDAMIVIYTTIDSRQTSAITAAIADGVAAGRRRGGARDKPVLICTMASASAPFVQCDSEIVPVYEFPEQAAAALGKAAAYAAWRSSPPGNYPPFDDLRLADARQLCRSVADARGNTWLTREELQRLLHAAGLRETPSVVAHSADEAAGLARVFGFPVVAKVASPKALHKTELGGVRLHLASDRAVRQAYDELTSLARGTLGEIDGILIQPMLSGGTEVLVGLSQDERFGPLVAFGLGGVNVELFKDVAFRIAPLTDRDADEMMRSVRGHELLQGYRNQPAADLHALRDVILKLSYLGAQVPELQEIEFNPIIALPAGRGCQIVDVRARVGAG